MVSPGSGSSFPPANRVLVQHRPYLCKAQPTCGLSTNWLLLPLPAHLLTSVKWENPDAGHLGHGHLAVLLSSPASISDRVWASPARHPHSPKWTITLANSFDLVSVWYRGTALLVFKQLFQVQDTGNNSKEILGTWKW